MATSWYLKLQGKMLGPFSSSELLEKVKRREITAETPVRKDDSKWITAREVNGLFDTAFPGDPASARRPTATEYFGDR
jgi:hypothetical protein